MQHLSFYRLETVFGFSISDADTSLNHDFFWADPLPCDLAKMLSHHTHSMFEFLAPPRRGRHHHQSQQSQGQQGGNQQVSQQGQNNSSSSQSQSRRSGHSRSGSASVASMSSCPERIF